MNEKLASRDVDDPLPVEDDLAALEGHLTELYQAPIENHRAGRHLAKAVDELSDHPVMQESLEEEVINHPGAQFLLGLNKKIIASVEGQILGREVHSYANDSMPIEISRMAYIIAIHQLEWDELTPYEADSVLRGIDEANQAARALIALRGTTFPDIGPDTKAVLKGISSSSVERMYRFTPTGNDGEPFLKTMIAEAKLDQAESLEIFAKVYRSYGGIDKLRKGQDELFDNFRDYYKLNNYEIALWSIDDEPQEFTPEGILEFEIETRKRMEQIIVDQLGISRVIFDKYLYAANPSLLARSEDDELLVPGYMSGWRVRLQLESIRLAVEGSNPQVVEYLVENIGLTNLHRYSGAQLNSLRNIVANDESASSEIERLRASDVTVIFVDALGDYNGALNRVLERFDDTAGNTLMFEVTRPSDLYRQMIRLKKLGIKPTNLVLATHGSAGGVTFNNGDDRFVVLSGNSGRKNGTKDAQVMFFEEASLDKLVGDDFMKTGEDGTRKVVVHACSSAVENSEIRSVTESIIRKIGRVDTKVYGADGVTLQEGSMADGGLVYRDPNPDSSANGKNITTEFTLKKPKILSFIPPKVNRRSVDSVKLNNKEAA